MLSNQYIESYGDKTPIIIPGVLNERAYVEMATTGAIKIKGLKSIVRVSPNGDRQTIWQKAVRL
jgi:hypothetical protein